MDKIPLVSVITLLLTDGGISRLSENSYEIFLTSNSKSIRELFKIEMNEIFGKKLDFKEIKSSTVTKVRICDVSIAKYLLKFSRSYRTRKCETYPICPKLKGVPEKAACRECKPINGYPPAEIPSIIKNGPLSRKKIAVKIAMSTDGGIEFHKIKVREKSYWQRRLFLRCHNPNLRKDWDKLIKDCGYNTTKTFNEIRISGIDQFNKYRNEIGFIENVKIHGSKRWKNHTKNEVLNIMINTFSANPAPKANRDWK